MKKILNEYDSTKKMLQTLRSYRDESKTPLSEQVDGDTGIRNIDDPMQQSQNNENDIDVINDVDINLVSGDNMDLQLSDEQRTSISTMIDAFREQVSQTANLEPGFNFAQQTIRLDGYVNEYDFKFHYIVGEGNGVYVSGEMVRLENEAMAVLQKLVAFHEQFVAAMDTMLRERQNN